MDRVTDWLYTFQVSQDAEHSEGERALLRRQVNDSLLPGVHTAAPQTAWDRDALEIDEDRFNALVDQRYPNGCMRGVFAYIRSIIRTCLCCRPTKNGNPSEPFGSIGNGSLASRT